MKQRSIDTHHDLEDASKNARRLGQTLLRLRRTTGISQVEFGRLLGLQQAAVSRIESGQQGVTAGHLAVISEYFKISADEVLLGRINYWQLAHEFGRPAPYPKRYQKLAYTKIREVLPFIYFMTAKYGDEFCQNQLAKLGLDSALFQCPDQNIGVYFLIDLVSDLLKSGHLSQNLFEQLILHTRGQAVHGQLHATYAVQRTAIEIIQARIVNSRHYELNFKYEIENMNSRGIELSITPAEHLSEVVYKDDVLEDFFCRYRKEYFRKFPLYINEKPVTVIEKGCHFSGENEKCHYLIRATE